MSLSREPALTPRYAKRSTATVSFAVWSLGIAGLAPSCACAQDISDKWQFAATVYGWFPDIGGSTHSAAGGGSSIDVDINTILDHQKMRGQGFFEIQKGHGGALTDLVYLDIGDSKPQTRGFTIGGQPLPGGIEAAADFDLKSVIGALAGSNRSFASPWANLHRRRGAWARHASQVGSYWCCSRRTPWPMRAARASGSPARCPASPLQGNRGERT